MIWRLPSQFNHISDTLNNMNKADDTKENLEWNDGMFPASVVRKRTINSLIKLR